MGMWGMHTGKEETCAFRKAKWELGTQLTPGFSGRVTLCASEMLTLYLPYSKQESARRLSLV